MATHQAAKSDSASAVGGSGSSSTAKPAVPPIVPASSSRNEQGTGLGKSDFLQELLSTPEPDLFRSRARSASDAAVLRRKGHLKEQDRFIEFLLHMHQTHTSLEVMQKMERWIAEHRRDPRRSRCSGSAGGATVTFCKHV